MEKSEKSVKELVTALAKARLAFEPIEKNKKVCTRNGQLMYAYATLDQIIEKTQKALSENGLCLIQLLSGDNGLITIETILAHSSGETLSSSITVPGNPKPQEAGSIITYYKRYSYSTLLGVNSEEDTDGSNKSGKQEPSRGAVPQKPTEQQRKMLNELFNRVNYSPSEKAVSNLKKMNSQQMAGVITYVSENESAPEFLEK